MENVTQLAWGACPGILDFIFKQVGTSIPFYRSSLHFFDSQKDIEINTSTTALTLNQTLFFVCRRWNFYQHGIFEVPQAAVEWHWKTHLPWTIWGCCRYHTYHQSCTGEDDDSAMITLEHLLALTRSIRYYMSWVIAVQISLAGRLKARL